MNKINLEIDDPETLAYGDTPAAFVRLDVEPIVFSIRGWQFFEPRFALVSLHIAEVKTREQFEHAYNAWQDLEATLLAKRIYRTAAAANAPAESRILKAMLDGGFDAATKEVIGLSIASKEHPSAP